MDEAITPVLDHLDSASPGGVIGVYLYGSAVVPGLRPDSDLDLLVLTRRSLTTSERAALTSLLLSVSGWRGHAERFPDSAHGRPIELTSIVIDDIRPWRDRVRRDFQFGEWRRADLVAGDLPRPAYDPDVVILMATAHAAHRILRGPALGEVVAPVPAALLRDAVLAAVPDVLAGIEGDERNTLLTLARILVTVESGRIVSKDAAAEAIAPTLDEPDRRLLERAQAGYLDGTADDWTGLRSRVGRLAHRLADRVGQHDSG